MSVITQRLRYFDGEYLRSGDFTDEQSYHVDMRRLLNHELHLSGIVTGLQIVQDQNSVASTTALFYSVSPGFAIDQIGREIYVSAPYSLTHLLSRAGLSTGLSELWIVYTETQSGSPAPGYQLCDQPNQSTRWTESFDVVLRQLGVAPDPNAPNPNHDLKGICLGVLNVNYDSTDGWYFSAPSDWYRRRHYAKIRAQWIIAPDQVEPDPVTLDGPNTFPPDGYIRVKTPNGVYSEGNMIVENNLLVGDDYTIQNTTPPGPGPSPTNPNGNLKLNSDIFLNGQIYVKDVNGNWTTLTGYVQSLAVADVQLAGFARMSVSGGIGTFSGTTTATSTAAFSTVDLQPYIAGFRFINQTTFNGWLGAVAPPVLGPAISDLTASFTTPPLPKPLPAGTMINISVACTVDGGAATATSSLFDSVDIACIAIFRP
ncbi:hypothetical protein [Candidatus Binatus sp.]|uniref:hypothetical protein n=1 Tax=Candidatus Binatus sp. TaxID=2811406 RepID=UPI003CC6C40C